MIICSLVNYSAALSQYFYSLLSRFRKKIIFFGDESESFSFARLCSSSLFSLSPLHILQNRIVSQCSVVSTEKCYKAYIKQIANQHRNGVTDRQGLVVNLNVVEYIMRHAPFEKKEKTRQAACKKR